MLKNVNEPNRTHSSFRTNLPNYILLAPFVILFMCFTVIPIVSSVVLSFFNFDMINMPSFIAFDNYKRMLVGDKSFLVILKNTIILAVITGPLGFMFAFVLAWFLNEFRPAVRTVLSFMFYAPSLVGNAFFIWQVAFSNDSYGYANSLLLSIGAISEPVQWLKNAEYVMPIVIMVQLWQGMGVSFLANISGLQNINDEMYEAGAIDGIRNRWQELWYITLPSMKSMLMFSAVMQIAAAFSISAIPKTLAGYPSVNNSVDTVVSYLADVGNVKYELGYASAISVLLFAMMFLTRTFVAKLLNKTGK
ncbi:MAG: sugar ABC transporter permease [Clostridia bacterium]|nr:sugar ABC transporter permease [Clostridia bacterium]